MIKKKLCRNGRYFLRLRQIYPAILGISLGFAFSMLYIPASMEEEDCVYNVEFYNPITRRSRENVDSSDDENVVVGATVKPKLSKYGPSFRPYYVASELTIRESIMIGVLSTETNLEALGTAINNTWLPNFPLVVLYVPFAKDSDFTQRYSKILGLPVVQLADTKEGASSKTKVTFKMLEHMHKNYNNKYNWFMRVEETTYLEANRLVNLIEKVNSSMDIYAGLPGSYRAESTHEPTDMYTSDRYCHGQGGVIISRITLDKIVPHLDTCLENALTDEEDVELGRCLLTYLQLQCTWNTEMADYFVTVLDHLKNSTASSIKKWLKDSSTIKAISFSPISSDNLMYYIHQYFIEQELEQSFEEIKNIQEEVKALLPHLPDGVIEKRPTWPIGYPQPYVPKTRFGVIGWQYFTMTHIYGFSEDNPEILLEHELKADVDEVYSISLRMVEQELGSEYNVFWLINGYRKFDMVRGTDYLLDIGAKTSESSTDEVRKRVQLLRPLTVLESVHMPHPVEQRGIYMVLPVVNDDHAKLERFLSMYQTSCLQTGENVLLLTVFVNVHDPLSSPVNDNSFIESKVILDRFKNKFKWAQVPWIQVKANQNSDRLLLDVVSMKLPVNALIFLARLDVEFTVNFLTRCRMNVVGGEQVFFPIPFGKFNPNIVYRNKPIPEKFTLTKDTGVWDTDAHDLVCFENKDYKNIRVNKDSFLQEQKPEENEVLNIFQDNGFRVFRATEPELRRVFEKKKCSDYTPKSDEHEKCLNYLKRRLGSRAQLSAILLEKEPDLH